HILDRAYVQAVADYCRAKDLTLIIDEVQTGIGRTGKLFAYEHFGIQPDIITLAKGLGGGLPIGACLTTEALKPHFGTGSHGSTFGGNPVACAGAKVMLDRIANPAFLQKVEAKGQLLETCLVTCPGIDKIDRLGLMVGLTPRDKAPKDVLDACLIKGLLILTAKNKIRLLPPLSISEEDLQRGCAILSAVLSEE
ncbi:MAG: aspartate aminotransferase family protein, partial [Peptococcus niger]